MLVVKNRGYKRGYKRKYIYGGSGMFETISDFLRRLLGSTVVKQVARQAASAALDAGKTAAVTAGKKLADRVVNKLTKQPKPTEDDLRRKASEVIGKYLSTASPRASPTSGSGNAIAIQDLVRRMNGSGLKVLRTK